MKKSIIYLLGIAVVIPAFMSCSDFLDQNPDLRTTLDSEEKIANILVSAYISGAGSYQLVAELSSDNVCDYGITKNYNQFYQDVYEWAEEVTSNNDAPRNIWSSNYNNIANANQALSAIEELGGPTTTRLKASKGEALICRAYSHFVLANMFCMPYNPATAGNCLGIPYMDHAETDLNPRYERGTLQEVYEMIGKDIEAGIPLIDDTAYSVPKYHFNYKAACCFASRYYLFMQDWDNAIKYATMALTSNPSSLLRDYNAIAALPNGTSRHQEYVNSASTANFLLQAATSNSGLLFDWYSTAGRYSHGKLQGIYETVQPKKGGPWGSSVTFKAPHAVLASSGKYVLPRTWRVFQYTDPVAGTGFNKAISVLFTSEEALLNRAEAYIMKMNEDPTALDKALELVRVYGVSLDDLARDSVGVSTSCRGERGRDLHVLAMVRGCVCRIDCDNDDWVLSGAGTTDVRVLDVDADWMRVEYERRNAATLKKERVVQLVDVVDVTCISIVEGPADAVEGEGR